MVLFTPKKSLIGSSPCPDLMPSTSIYQFSFLNNGLFDLKKLNIGRFQGPELTLSHFKSTISRGPTPFCWNENVGSG
jgi:hypothetical protein